MLFKCHICVHDHRSQCQHDQGCLICFSCTENFANVNNQVEKVQEAVNSSNYSFILTYILNLKDSLPQWMVSKFYFFLYKDSYKSIDMKTEFIQCFMTGTQ